MKIEIEKIKFFVNHSIESLKSRDLLWTFDPNIPKNMRNTEIQDKNGWYAWKDTESLIDDIEINKLEQKIDLKYPNIYREFLKYRHFYKLEKIENIDFFTHKSENWDSDLLNQYKIKEPEITLEKGLIPFGFCDGGKISCFDTNNNNRIISVFYDSNLNTESENEIIFDNFSSMLDSYYEKNNCA